MECNFFYKLNKVFFLLMLVSVLFQSMDYNGIIDIPSLFLILLLISFYEFRKAYNTLFTLYNFFMAYYFIIVTFLKLFYHILSKNEYWQQKMVNEPEDFWVKTLMTIFGVKISTRGQFTDTGDALRYITSIIGQLLVIYFAHSWSQAKWIDVMEVTNESVKKNKKLGYISRFEYYLSNRSIMKSND